MQMLPVYIVLVCLLWLAGARTAVWARVLRLPPLLTTAILLSSVIYASCLIPGALGFLYTSVVYFICALSCIALIFLLPRISPYPGSHDATPIQHAGIHLSRAEVFLTGAGLLGFFPLIAYFRWGIPARLLTPDRALGWDTVTYHLPGVIEFWQNNTLWSQEGPYQSYSYAFELLGTFLSHPFHSHWGLVLADAIAVILLLAAITFVARTLAACVTACATSSWIPSAVLAIAVWSSVHAHSIGDVGKNDIFMTACLISALGYLLHGIMSPLNRENGHIPPLLLSSLALGLALGTKPSALAFVPLFFLGYATLLMAGDQPGFRCRRFATGIGMAALVTFTLGGFWLARNIVVYGSISPWSEAFTSTLAANIGNARLYDLKRESLLFVLGFLAVLPCLYLVFVSRRSARSIISMSFLLIFHVVACAAFAITPYAVHHELHSFGWKLRLGMPLFVSAALVLALSTTHVLAVLSQTSPRFLRVTGALFFLSAMLYLPTHWRTHRAVGLPGFEQIKGLPRTGIYAWIDSQPDAMRIYAAGLRPYGLYGQAWQNVLFYDLHSTSLAPLEAGIERISAIVVQFQPDLIMISVDPHTHSGRPEKPKVAGWMQEHPLWFQEVYSDDTVTAFRVNPAAVDQLRDTVPPGYSLNMGG
jgi:hypothetical protein